MVKSFSILYIPISWSSLGITWMVKSFSMYYIPISWTADYLQIHYLKKNLDQDFISWNSKANLHVIDLEHTYDNFSTSIKCNTYNKGCSLVYKGLHKIKSQLRIFIKSRFHGLLIFFPFFYFFNNFYQVTYIGAIT